MKNGRKINYDKIVKTTILSIALILGIIAAACVFPSCSQQYHKDKYIHKGGTFECDTVFQDVLKTIKGKDGEDSLIYVPTPVPCPPCVSETRYQTRWKYKYLIKKDKQDTKQVKAVENAKVDIFEEQTEQVKSKTKGIVKTAFPWEWFFGAIVAICLMLYLIFRKK